MTRFNRNTHCATCRELLPADGGVKFSKWDKVCDYGSCHEELEVRYAEQGEWEELSEEY